MARLTNRRVACGSAWLLNTMMLALLMPTGAHAAPFCLQSEAIPPQCIYFNADTCRRDANRQGGYCGTNPDEVHVVTNIGQYCVTTSQIVSLCVYLDRTSCEAEAARQHGACTTSPGRAPSGAPDPFAANVGR